MTEPLYLDNSILTSVACSTEATMRHVHGLTTVDEREYLRGGSAGHAAVAHWFRGGTREEAMAVFEGEFKQWADDNVRPDSRWSWANASEILDEWLIRHPLGALPFTVMGKKFVEVGFAYPLTDEGDIVFCGRMDALALSKNEGSVWVVDNKFPGSINETFVRQWKMDSQVDGYLWGAQKHLDKPVLGMFINAIQVRKLPSDPNRKCQKHAVPYAECGRMHIVSELLITQRTEEQLEEWRKSAISIAKRFRDLLRSYPKLEHIHKVRMQGKFFKRCAFCFFYDFCSSGRRLDMVDSMLVREPWQPYQGAFAGAHTSRKP